MMSTLTKEASAPQRRRAPEEKREMLLASARALFAQQGFDATSTVQIAAHAGVSEGILFHHFGSKRGLLTELARRYVEGAATATMPDDLGEMTEETIVRSAFSYAEQDPDLYQLFLDEGTKLEGFEIADASTIIISVIRKNLERGMAEGVVRKGDPHVMAELQFTIVDGAYRAWRKTGDPSRKEAYILEAIRCMKAMLAPLD